MHPRSPHSHRYDFNELIKKCPDLNIYVSINKYGDLSIDFADPDAVKMLNKALLIYFYKIEKWDIPPEDALAGTKRKLSNLKINTLGKNGKSVLNFGGQKGELWCPGGETAFIKRMIKESSEFPDNCFWYSTLVSKKENLSGIYKYLKSVNVSDSCTIEMTQGQKISRIVTWTYLSPGQQKEWREERW